MKAYVVGGVVRDELLGLPVADRDWVVVGATPEDMVRQGFRPVGKDFPVFLHPETHEEYALARTERKSGRGYRGFTVYSAPDVTLEADLARRDLTINAMARDESGRLIDPYGGEKDLREGVLRHVSAAFEEDPVRILRVARFVARLGFRIAPETMQLMRRMVESGEADHLVAERVWQEFARGLMETHPARMLEVLAECGLAARLLPELKNERAALERASQAGAPLPVRFAVLAWGLEEQAVRALCERLRAPNEDLELAQAASRCRPRLAAREPRALLELLKRTDAIRRPERFAQLLAAARLAAPEADLSRVEKAFAAAAAVDAGAIAHESAADIGARVEQAREKAITQALANM
ncbi:MAG: CCA tRNA nucleotidyltransferase [Betaproteobacteria bacterium]|nr:CCA tRNA nucleotidyltransferase [Betaproteobacteria bacterium]